MRRATLRPSNTDKLDPENGGCEWFVSDKDRNMTFLNRGNDMDGAYRWLVAELREGNGPNNAGS